MRGRGGAFFPDSLSSYFRRAPCLPVGPYCNRTANSRRKREIPASAAFVWRSISRKYNAPIVKKRWSGTLFDARCVNRRRKGAFEAARRRVRRTCERVFAGAGRRTRALSGLRSPDDRGAHKQKRPARSRASHSARVAYFTRQASRPSVIRSCGSSMPMNTILLVFFSTGSHLAARSLPIIWCTPWNTTLRSTPFM